MWLREKGKRDKNMFMQITYKLYVKGNKLSIANIGTSCAKLQMSVFTKMCSYAVTINIVE